MFLDRLLEAPHLFIHFLSPAFLVYRFRFFGLEAVPFTVHCRLLSSFSRWLENRDNDDGLMCARAHGICQSKTPVYRLCNLQPISNPNLSIKAICSLYVLCSICVKEKASTFSMLTPKFLNFNTIYWLYCAFSSNANYTRLPLKLFKNNRLWPLFLRV